MQERQVSRGFHGRPGTRIGDIGGTANDTADVGTTTLHGLSRLGLNDGTYAGGDGMPASITLGMLAPERSDQLAGRSFPAANRDLEITVNTNPTRTITIGPPHVPDPNWATADELAAAIRDGLSGDPVHVVACTPGKYVVLHADPGRTVAVSGTAADRLGLRPFPRESITLRSDPFLDRHLGRHRRNFQSYDLSSTGADLELDITDGTATARVTFDGSGMGNLRSVTSDELYRAVRTALAAAAPTPAVEVRFATFVARGATSELAYSRARPDRVWAGRTDGLVSRSDDDGATWTTLGAGVLDKAEARVEALAPHPTDPDVAFVGHWSPVDLPTHHAMVHRTENGGTDWIACGIEFDGREIAVRALAIHPTEADTVFAATDNGVFWTADNGQNWSPFSEGLPHCGVIDLALDEDGPHLVAATWGAGAYRRYIGAAAPDDVRLHVRTDELDRGDASSVVAMDPFTNVAGFERPSSPDIRFTRPGLSTVHHDGVRFDLDVLEEQPVAGQDFDVLVQVHNRGSLPARFGPQPADPKVRVVLLGADVEGEPPDLPADFWMQFTGGALAGTLGDWTVLGDTTLPRELVAETPQVVRQNVPTATMGLGGRAVGVLVLVSATDDVLTTGDLTIRKLTASERRAAYRQVDVLQALEDTRLVLRGTNGQTIEIVNAPPATSPAAAALRLTAGSGTRLVATPSPVGTTTYDLSAADPWITISEQLPPLSITFDNDHSEFVRFDRARPVEVARYISRRMAAAGLPMACLTNEEQHRLRALGDATVEVRGGSGTGGNLLTYTPANAQSVVNSPTATDFMPMDATLDLRLRAHGRTDDVTLSVDIDRDWKVADLINRQLRDRGLDGMLVAENPIGIYLYPDRTNEHTLSFQLGGSAADLARLGLTAGTHTSGFGVNLAPVDLTPKPTITFTVTHNVRVRLRRDPVADPTANAVSPALVRETINRFLAEAKMAIAAEPGRLGLVIGESSSDRGPSTALTGSGDLAEIATSGSGAAGTPSDLFDIRRALAADRLQEGQANHVYVRGRNDGNVDTTNGRWRLYRIEFGDPAVNPVVTHHLPPGPPHSANIPADSRQIEDVSYTPTAAAGEVEVVLAILDDDADGGRLDPPGPTWPDASAFLEWVDLHHNAAVRRFEVTT